MGVGSATCINEDMQKNPNTIKASKLNNKQPY